MSSEDQKTAYAEALAAAREANKRFRRVIAAHRAGGITDFEYCRAFVEHREAMAALAAAEREFFPQEPGDAST